MCEELRASPGARIRRIADEPGARSSSREQPVERKSPEGYRVRPHGRIHNLPYATWRSRRSGCRPGWLQDDHRVSGRRRPERRPRGLGPSSDLGSLEPSRTAGQPGFRVFAGLVFPVEPWRTRIAIGGEMSLAAAMVSRATPQRRVRRRVLPIRSGSAQDRTVPWRKGD